jgi:hypothetical protein
MKVKENLLNELITENFSNLGKEMDNPSSQDIWNPNRYDQKRTSPHDIVVQVPRVHSRERTLKDARERH